MAQPSTTVELLELVSRSGICPTEQLNDRLRTVTDLPRDALRSAAVLVRHGLLTQFQAKQLLAGRSNGFKLGPYVIQEQIGQGGMGAVYLAEHEALRRRVALKVLLPPKDLADAKLAVERFLREARAAAALDHPNIVRIHDVCRHGSINYLVMEYVEGNTLEGLLARGGPITPSRAVGYVAQAAAGLQHAHEKGFVHRDIKPANLILGKDGVVKILDMGLARSFRPDDKLTEVFDHGAVVGTADFISPEQALQDREIDIRADIYSLGATFFALVTNRPPFEGTTPQKLVQHQMADPPSLTELDPTFPKRLAEVVETTLAKDPDDRYQTPADLIEALAPWLAKGGEAGAAVGPSAARVDVSAALQATRRGLTSLTTRRIRNTPRRRGGARRPAVTWAAGAAGVLVVGLVGYLAFGGRAADPAPKAGAKVPSPSAAALNPAAPGHMAGQVVYRLDAAKVPEFRERYEGISPLSGRQPPLPSGVRPQCWQKGSEGDFVCEPIDGVPALGLTNLTDVTATQYALLLEGSCGCPLEENREYTVRVEYRTRGRPDGHVYVQSEKYAHIAGLFLTPSEDRWKVSTLKFRRQPDVPVQITVGLKGGGPNTSLFLRFVEVTRN
jgi:serine/threonine protein kinase